MRFKVKNERLSTLLNAIMVGTLAGLVVSTFRLLIANILIWFQNLYKLAVTNIWYLIIIIVLNITLAVMVGFLVKTTPEIAGSGIPQIEGQLEGLYEEAWWPVLWKKFIGGVLAIGSGLMLGREGPSIQLGAVVGQGVGEFRHFNGSKRRVMIASGAAAGLSAAFNAPIASTMFVLEEIYHSFSPLVWIGALTSAIFSNFVSLNYFGLTPTLAMSHPHPFPLVLYLHLVIMGIGLGFFGRLYQIVMLKLKSWYGKIHFLPKWLYGLVSFILIIPVGLIWPQYLGGGNGLIPAIANSNPVLITMVILLIVRFVFSMVSYGSGLPGGIFLPILTLGAVFGTVYVGLMVSLHLLTFEYLPNFVIYAMAGYFGAVGKAPFTAVLLITEMVGSIHHLMPLAVVVLTAYIVIDMLGGNPIYESLLRQLIPEDNSIDHNEKDYVEIPVTEESDLDGKYVHDITWPSHSLLVNIKRGSGIIIPNGDTKLQIGDRLNIVTTAKYRGMIWRYFK